MDGKCVTDSASSCRMNRKGYHRWPAGPLLGMDEGDYDFRATYFLLSKDAEDSEFIDRDPGLDRDTDTPEAKPASVAKTK